jgi:hypothetical protein
VDTSTASRNLSKCMGAVLKTGQYADMKFLICDGNKPLLTEDSTDDQDASNCLQAHRVILASRCDWFRRALTSGMKESIERYIHLYDKPNNLFQVDIKKTEFPDTLRRLFVVLQDNPCLRHRQRILPRIS